MNNKTISILHGFKCSAAFLAALLCLGLSACGGGGGTARTGNGANQGSSPTQPGVYLVAGNIGGGMYLDGTGNQARFLRPAGIARAPSGTIYLAESANGAIRRITDTGQVSSLALQSAASGALSAQGGSHIIVDGSGNLVVAGWNCGGYLIKVAPDGTAVSLDPSDKLFFRDPLGTRTDCYVWQPVGLAPVRRAATT